AETTKHKQVMQSQFDRWNPDYQGVENRTFGLNIIQTCVKAGLPIRPLQADTDKVSRARPVAARYETGSVYHPQGAPWLVDYEDELVAFPNGTHDDQVDVTAYAYISIIRGDEYKIIGGLGKHDL
ncbi:MAG: phage terminase large subunit, partial [Methanosarcinales archaeon]|nr:phage terminase large subunit [Methanosarcinales archaeon]